MDDEWFLTSFYFTDIEYGAHMLISAPRNKFLTLHERLMNMFLDKIKELGMPEPFPMALSTKLGPSAGRVKEIFVGVGKKPWPDTPGYLQMASTILKGSLNEELMELH